MADLLKEGGHVVREKLAALFSQCLETLKGPIAWKNTDIILIHKKGDNKDVEKLHVTCVQAVYRSSNSQPHKRPRPVCVFRKGYPTTEHIRVQEKNLQSTHGIRDYEKAFDSVQC